MCNAHVGTDQDTKPYGGRLGLGRLFQKAVGAALFAVLLMAFDIKVGHAALQQDDPFAGVEVLGAAELAEKRGGFLDAALGISLNLGANIRSLINGKLVLETLVKFANAGATLVSQKVPDGVDLTGLTFLSSDGAAIAGVTGIATANTTGPVTFSSNGSQITVPAGFQGLVAQSDTGVSAAVSKITKDQFANLVVNTDPGAAVQQTLNINIDVFGFAALQQSIKLNTATTRFRDAMRAASLGALGLN